ncbi:hypothetical protein B5P44_00580 [Mycobacterium sp. CBMA 213]|uniref:Uncharacterized protein n=1 Tax=Mycolicibacterium sp. CBMA 213 TaxID=1968788 RepID=A0A343VR99_9MYCO|nr:MULTISPECIES: hypothetical protein [unclassified Mycolicibacterium]AVN58423.1 hypothetical protein B5P44_p00128 [Mycolicibacterium sp. CBMA 213]MUL61081.1 hypothetical protein [Mycolicibacterium sp. CBMA 335]MUM03319.1 hypothetical protein [Mycolicibacterium sp. CBMA 213]
MSAPAGILMWIGLAFAVAGSLLALFTTRTSQLNTVPTLRAALTPTLILGVGALLLIISAVLQFAGY